MSHDMNLTTPQLWLRRILILVGILLFAFGVYLLMLDVWLTDNTGFNAVQTYAMFMLMNSTGAYANYGEMASQTVSIIADPVGRSAVMLVPVIANKTYFLAIGIGLFLLGLLLPRLLKLPDYLSSSRASRGGLDGAAAPDGGGSRGAPEPARYAPSGTPAADAGTRYAPEPARYAPPGMPAADAGARYTPEPAAAAPRRTPGMTVGAMLPPLDRAVGVPRDFAGELPTGVPGDMARDIPVAIPGERVGDMGGRVCPACGMPAAEDNAVCVYCGQPLAAQAFCRVCGKPLQPEDRFCAFCASPVEDAPTGMPAPAYDAPRPTPAYDAPRPTFDYGAPAPTPPPAYRPSGEPAATKGMKIPTGL